MSPVTVIAIRKVMMRSRVNKKIATGIKSLAGIPYFSMSSMTVRSSSKIGLTVYSRKAPRGLGSTDTCKDVVLPNELEVFTIKLEALSRVLSKADFLSYW